MAREQQYVLRYKEAERQAWQAAADRAGLPLAAWIRAACNLAAGGAAGGQVRVPTSDASPPERTVLSPEEAKAQAARIAGKVANILAEHMPDPRFPEIPQPHGRATVRHWNDPAPAQEPMPDCDHPREARKQMPYGTLCQQCGGMVNP
jgi:hypothetical protein